MALSDALPYQGTVAVLATKHAKQRVIGPVLREGLGLIVEVAETVDTDQFGTFTGEIERKGSQLDAAHAKIAAAFKCFPSARVAIASEGSFGPHPYIPFLPLGRELVVLADRDKKLVLVGHHAGSETNYGHKIVKDCAEAASFAEMVKFPSHGLIVMGCANEAPETGRFLDKDVTDFKQLKMAVAQAVGICGSAFIQTDMRAHRNPTRMEAIERAANDLVRLCKSQCPQCSWPGFDVTERVPGLPCSYCGEPTIVMLKHVLVCGACKHREERPASDLQEADPGQCPQCNP